MRYLVLSDIHANIFALKAALNFCKRKKYSKTLFLGDLVGYGASPNAVVERIKRLKEIVCVRGNHDKVCSGIEDGYNFNDKAKIAAHWTFEKLVKQNLEFIRKMPRGPVEISKSLSICHGSPLNEDFYIFSEFDAYQVFSKFKTRIMFFGHTHMPCYFEFDGKVIYFKKLHSGDIIQLKKNCKYLINPGSVGQPRDRNIDASFAIFDDTKDKLYSYRTRYDIESAKNKILNEGLPHHLAIRLDYGV